MSIEKHIKNGIKKRHSVKSVLIYRTDCPKTRPTRTYPEIKGKTAILTRTATRTVVRVVYELMYGLNC